MPVVFRVVVPVVLLLTVIPVSAEEPAVQTLPFGIEDCTGLIALVKVPAGALQPYVPPGFRLRGQGTNNLVNLAVEADRCARMTTAEGTVKGGEYGVIWVAADPPQALRVEGPAGYYLGWDTLIPDETRRSILTAAGVPVWDGSVETVAGDEVRAHTMTMEGLGTFHVVASGAEVPLPGSGRVVQYGPSADGTLSRWRYDYTNSVFGQGSAGLVTLPEGSWLAEVAGTTVAPAVFFVGIHMTYYDGSIEFPIVNPAA